MTTRPCFECNGTGEKCDACGEAENVCTCQERHTYSPCDGCDGTGEWHTDDDRAPASSKEGGRHE